MDSASVTRADWQRALVKDQSVAAELFSPPEAEQKRLAYFHTQHEICQQPWTWLRTCDRMIASRDGLRRTLSGLQSLVLTGSGSSKYAGECVRLTLQNELEVWTESIGGGLLLTYGGKVFPLPRPGVLVSIARSGDSPESRGAIQLLLDTEPEIRHLVMTCKEQGGLTKAWRDPSKVHVITLPPETNDKSLVMTSSFTNLLLATRFLGMLDRTDKYQKLCEGLSRIVRDLIRTKFDILAKVAASDCQRVVFLTCGPRFGASREAALKMLEMTAGRVTALCETYLGFRHGPMSFI